MPTKPVIQPAERVGLVEEYYFARKLKEVAAMNARGLDVVSLGIGGPDKPPAADVVETMVESARKTDTHSYQPFGGLPALRRAWADWYGERYGVTVDPATELQPLIGSKEAVMHISMTFLNPGDGVLVPDPGYPTYTSASRLAGGRVIPYHLKEANGWQPAFDEIERTTDLTGVKLMWMNYTHMPTGAPASEETFKKGVEFARKHSILIVHDNPYSFIGNDTPRSILSTPGAKDVAIELNSLSKSHNMAGWRMGVVVGRPEYIGWIVKVKSNVDSGQFKPAMEAAVKALHAPQEWYDSINDLYRGRRALGEQVMEVLGCHVAPGQTGMFVWGRVPDKWSSGEALTDWLLQECRVFATPGMIFGQGGDRYIRISLCATEDRLQEALKRINEMK